MTFNNQNKKNFIINKKESLSKRVALFLLIVGVWLLSEYFLRPFLGSIIQEIRNFFGGGTFVQHIFSKSLPVDLICLVMLIGLYKLYIIPRPTLYNNLVKSLKEGLIWGLLICVPTIPLALSLDFKLDFDINWPSILGNVISNSYEEITYRVFLFSIAAYTFRNIWISVLFVALLFALGHTQYPISMQIIVGIASVCFSMAYIRANSVFAAILAHQVSDMILDSILFK
ncbi:MAG: CPBP family intramembrane metalloprotease [Bacteriovoracaceae bacterium]|jgi:membrane protease YdiL (CAAX protease family)|nr:CPBP family intramembrane metalloprotease [Bacteriovoracaceae bacterium]